MRLRLPNKGKIVTFGGARTPLIIVAMPKETPLTFATSEGNKYTPKVFSALKTQVSRQAKKRFGVYPKPCSQEKKKENAYTLKSLQGVCGGPLRTVLLYRFLASYNRKSQRFVTAIFGALQIMRTQRSNFPSHHHDCKEVVVQRYRNGVSMQEGTDLPRAKGVSKKPVTGPMNSKPSSYIC